MMAGLTILGFSGPPNRQRNDGHVGSIKIQRPERVQLRASVARILRFLGSHGCLIWIVRCFVLISVQNN